MTIWSAKLRQELCTGARAYAATTHAESYESLGKARVVMFPTSADGAFHGNFHPLSYKAIVENPDWAPRLLKVHSQRERALPAPHSGTAREMDSCTSSDALLMNIICFPGSVRGDVSALLGVPDGAAPLFGVRGAVPLHNGRGDATEINMQLGLTNVEAKLTEASFTTMKAKVVEQYVGLRDVFDHGVLPRLATSADEEPEYVSYQLIRNVLAIATRPDRQFRVLLDGRRPDLIREWWTIHGAIRDSSVRGRCGFILWQELAQASPAPLREFLSNKYGL